MNIRNDLTVVIVSFNSYQAISDSLGDFIKKQACRIIVVDNASSDGSVAALKHHYPHLEIVELNVNIGYGRAANIGLEMLNTDFALLLNPDVSLRLDALQKIFDVVTKDNKLSAIYAPALSKKTFLRKGDVDVDYLIGAFLLLRMSCLSKTGFFDENIFLFYEEKDLEFRLKKKGYNLLLLSDYYVEHLGGASSTSGQFVTNLRNWHVGWSSLYYSYKNGLMKSSYQGFYLMYRYGLKSIVNFNSLKRLKYKARYQGCKAYLSGEGAFDENGFPKMPTDM